ncbi:MAG: hypothetical protein J6J59_07390 [Peptococcaceae bacterium]|nr:hypothetical protein [Peptococcaceae bacterium]
MDLRSTLEFKSNLQLAKKNIPLSEDREFYVNIVDPFAIGQLKKYRPNDLTEIQRQIYDRAGIHCMYADEGDYPWGVVRDSEGLARVVCKCLKTDCERFNICRPEFQKTDFCLSQDRFVEKILKNNTQLVLEKEIECSFEEYRTFTTDRKMSVLLDYWNLSEGPIVRIRFNDSEEAYLYNENGHILLNPFTKEPILIENVSIYKFSHLVFDIIEPCTDNNNIIYFIRSARKEECQTYASELLYEYKLSNRAEKKIKEDKKNRRKTTAEIKAKHNSVKDPKLCRHAGCYEIAVRDGYCSEHIRYQKAESK